MDLSNPRVPQMLTARKKVQTKLLSRKKQRKSQKQRS
jgi:hypothetical protein